MRDSIKSIATNLKNIDNILVFPHINMDGDALGSATALCLALRKMGKTAYVLINEPIPRNLDFLECGCCTDDPEILADVQLSMMLDCNSMNRIPGRESAWNKGRLKGCIDHHSTARSDIRFDFYHADPKSAATGELIYLLIKQLGVEIDLQMADCLFAAITTDTGNFQHNNTTRRTHEIVAHFYTIEGFDSKNISALIYDRRRKEALLMESTVLAELNFFKNGALAVGCVTQALLEATGCSMDESDGIIQRIMSIDGVEVGALFKETAGGTRVSLRAKSYADVSEAAAKFSGGGHVRAAGCSFSSNLEDAMTALIPELEKILK